MLTQQAYKQTSGQVDPKCEGLSNNQDTPVSFIINGCAVSFSSNAKNTGEPIKAIKEILLSAYRTKTARG